MLGNIRTTAHLAEEDEAPASSDTAGTDVSQCVCAPQPVCVRVCGRRLTHKETACCHFHVKGQWEAVGDPKEQN